MNPTWLLKEWGAKDNSQVFDVSNWIEGKYWWRINHLVCDVNFEMPVNIHMALSNMKLVLVFGDAHLDIIGMLMYSEP